MLVCVYACVTVCVCVCMLVCMYACVCVDAVHLEMASGVCGKKQPVGRLTVCVCVCVQEEREFMERDMAVVSLVMLQVLIASDCSHPGRI